MLIGALIRFNLSTLYFYNKKLQCLKRKEKIKKMKITQRKQNITQITIAHLTTKA